jgi:CSLREA domain-containing protein
LTVETASDEQTTNGECSLREAIVNANGNDQSGPPDCPAGGGGDRIVFDLEDPPATVTLASQLPAVTDTAGLTVDGAGVTISGAGKARVFEVAEGAQLALNGLTVADGDGAPGLGGGVLNLGTLKVSNSTLSGNSAGSGGGIHNYGHGAVLDVRSSTLSDNSAGQSGGGIEHSGGSARLRNTIVAGSPSGGDCHRPLDGSVSRITDGGYNLS